MIIDDLPSISIANDSDEIAIEQGTATKKITKGNFLQEVVSSIQSLIASVNGKVSKAGDTMTGDLTVNGGVTVSNVIAAGTAYGLDNSSWPINPATAQEIPDSDSFKNYTFRDKNQTVYARMRGRIGADRVSGMELQAVRNVNGNRYNTLDICIDKDGNDVVTVSNPEAWRKAIGIEWKHASFASSATVTASGRTAAVIILTANNAARCGIYLIYFHSNTTTPQVVDICSADGLTTSVGAGSITFSVSATTYIDVWPLYEPERLSLS